MKTIKGTSMKNYYSKIILGAALLAGLSAYKKSAITAPGVFIKLIQCKCPMMALFR